MIARSTRQPQNPPPRGDDQEQVLNLDLTGYAQQQIDLLMQVASAFPRAESVPQPREQRGSQMNVQNEQSEAHSQREGLIVPSPV